MTITTPFRRMILHLLQIFFTEDRTFMEITSRPLKKGENFNRLGKPCQQKGGKFRFIFYMFSL